MLHNIWNILLYKPLVNALDFLIYIIPAYDVGIAVVVLTILVKIILFPLSQASIRNQAAMSILAPELDKIKKSGASKEEQARLTFDLYKQHKTNPFSGLFLVLIQIPIIFALYYAFYKGINFNSEALYSFVHLPVHINMIFLGFLDISKKSIFLAILAGVSQYLQAQFMPKPKLSSSSSTMDDFNKSMNMQMKYFFPFLIAFIAYRISGVIALYWITNNMFTVLQQIYVGKTEKKILDKEVEILITKN